MDSKQNYLSNLHSYIEGIDKEVTMILQSLQWDRKHLLEGVTKVTCKYDQNHRVPPDKKEAHEKGCLLKSQGYSKSEKLLPDPPDPNTSTLVKLCKADIEQIINNASNSDPTFRKGPGSQGPEPQTLERLQATYTSDERRAIHDAVVTAVPSCHDLTDLALQCTNDEEQKTTTSKSRGDLDVVVLAESLEILAELRDMKRRRTKYRGSTKSRNYSDVLRDVITTQMELYTGTPAQAPLNLNQPSTSQNGSHHDTVNIKQEDDSYSINTRKPEESRNSRRDEMDNNERERHHRERKRYDDYRNNYNHKERDKYNRPDRSNRYNNDYKHYNDRSSHSGNRDEYIQNKRIKQEKDRSKSKERYERDGRDRQSRYSDKYEARSDRYDRTDKYSAGPKTGKRYYESEKYDERPKERTPKGTDGENHRRYYDTNIKNEKLSYDDGRKRKRHS